MSGPDSTWPNPISIPIRLSTANSDGVKYLTIGRLATRRTRVLPDRDDVHSGSPKVLQGLDDFVPLLA